MYALERISLKGLEEIVDTVQEPCSLCRVYILSTKSIFPVLIPSLHCTGKVIYLSYHWSLLHVIPKIQSFLSTHRVKTFIQAFVIFGLSYWNILFSGLDKSHLSLLIFIWIDAAKILCFLWCPSPYTLPLASLSVCYQTCTSFLHFHAHLWLPLYPLSFSTKWCPWCHQLHFQTSSLVVFPILPISFGRSAS